MLLNNDICNALLKQQFLQQYILLAKNHFLVSNTMFRRISNASNSYFGLPTMKELNVSIRSSDKLCADWQPTLFLGNHSHDGYLAYWLIRSEINYFDKGRLLQAHLK